MADMDYDREISPQGERERDRERRGGRERKGSGKELRRDLEMNVVPLASGIRDDRLLCEWPL